MYRSSHEVIKAFEAVYGEVPGPDVRNLDGRTFSTVQVRNWLNYDICKSPCEITAEDIQALLVLAQAQDVKYARQDAEREARRNAPRPSDNEIMDELFAYDSSDDRSPSRPAPTPAELAARAEENRIQVNRLAHIAEMEALDSIF